MMHFTCKGEGSPIVLLHGFCESSLIWDYFSSHLSQNFKVYCPDLPGFGSSLLHEESISLEETAVLLQGWMEDQDIKDPIVIGHSLGGYVTLALAELMGSLLKGIGLFHSTSFADNEAKKEVRNRAIQFVKKHGVQKFTDTFVPPLFEDTSGKNYEEEIKKVQNIAEKTSFNGFIAFTAAMRDRKERCDVLRDFKNPSLFIAGLYDQAVTIDNSRKHQFWVTDYEEVDCGHMGMFEKPEETLQIVKRFCDRLER
jgi:pimeloyl-ACP methyl ester carboxylesterase